MLGGLQVSELRPTNKGRLRSLIISEGATKAISGFGYEEIIQTLERVSGIIQRRRKQKFVCQICLRVGISREDATRNVEEGFIPRKKTKVEGLICEHCHDCEF